MNPPVTKAAERTGYPVSRELFLARSLPQLRQPPAPEYIKLEPKEEVARSRTETVASPGLDRSKDCWTGGGTPLRGATSTGRRFSTLRRWRNFTRGMEFRGKRFVAKNLA